MKTVPTRTPYRVIRLHSWGEFLDLTADSPYHNWAFRGQRDASMPMFSALSRYLITYGVDPRAWSDQEQRILRIFKRKAIHFLPHVPDRHDDFQWLALMQDHGAPTRLLDFTWSPYVAAFFALHNAVSDSSIVACNPFEIEKTKKIDIENPGAYRKHFMSAPQPFVWMGEPHAMNRRLIAQSGTFLVPGVLDQPIEDILAQYPNPKETLIKFILPADKFRNKGMRELYKMNITQSTLFPDLDGLARSLAYELESHWAYDPADDEAAYEGQWREIAAKKMNVSLPLVLASQSPRRKELLGIIGVPFSVMPAFVDETPRPGETPEDFVARAAREKGVEVASRVSRSLVLSADTIVTIDGQILGKPLDENDAVRMLKKLSGRQHTVYTAVTLINQVKPEVLDGLDRTEVWFNPIDDAVIFEYIGRENVMDKAGAYAIQGFAAIHIPRIEGNYFNVMGLPLPLVYKLLSRTLL